MEQTLDEIKVAYVEAYETGHAPTLEAVIAAYPEYRDDLIDFILTFIEVEHAAARRAEPAEPSASTRWSRGKAVREACGTETLREAREAVNLTQQQIADAVGVPANFIVRIERGRLIPDGDNPIHPKFLARLGQALRRTADEVLDVLRTTFANPPQPSRSAHNRATGQPTAGVRPPPQSFRELLADCNPTPSQRREWLDG